MERGLAAKLLTMSKFLIELRRMMRIEDAQAGTDKYILQTYRAGCLLGNDIEISQQDASKLILDLHFLGILGNREVRGNCSYTTWQIETGGEG